MERIEGAVAENMLSTRLSDDNACKFAYNGASCAGASALTLALRRQAMASLTELEAQPAFSA